MPEPQQKLVKVPDLGVVAFPPAMDDDSILKVIRKHRNKASSAPLATESSEHERQLKPAQPLSSALPSLPDWANTPIAPAVVNASHAVDDFLTRGQTKDLREKQAKEHAAYEAAHPVYAGINQGLQNFGNQMTTPVNAALTVLAPESKMLSAYFAYQAGKGAFKDAKAAEAAYKAGNNQEAARFATQAVLSAGVAGAAGAHASYDLIRTPLAQRIIQDQSGFMKLPGRPEAPEAKPVDQDRLADILKHTETLTNLRNSLGQSTSEQVRALRDAVEETGRRQAAAGDTAAATHTAHQDIALSKIIAETERRAKTSTPQPVDQNWLQGMLAKITGPAAVQATTNQKTTPVAQIQALKQEAAKLNPGAQQTPQTMNTSDIVVSPNYQFNPKANPQTGLVEPLQGVFDQDKAGPVTVWKNPEDGRTYLVHGFHRMDLANRSGVPSVAVQQLPASDVPDLQGRLQVRKWDKEKAAPIDATMNQTSTPEFKNWFGQSKVVDERGQPKVLYHGTSKDQPFTSFKIGRNGTWFTEDPESASSYATDNDSKTLKYDHDTRNYKEVNTQSRVIPAYVKIENPYVMTSDDFAMINVDNYKRAQGLFFDQLRARGYDGVNMGRGVWAVLKDPSQIKSSIGNRGTFDPSKSDFTMNLKYKAADQNQPFYLKSERILNDKVKGPMPAQDVSKMLLANGVKAEEMKWTGLDKFLEDKGSSKVTPKEIQDFLAQNDLQIEEVTHGGIQHGKELKERWQVDNAADRGTAIYGVNKRNGMLVTGATTGYDQYGLARFLSQHMDQLSVHEGIPPAAARDPKYGSYVLPGARDYRELLVTMPPSRRGFEDDPEIAKQLDPLNAKLDELWDQGHRGAEDPQYRAVLQQRNAIANAARQKENDSRAQTFTSSHWDEPNILGHVRFNDRTGPNGEKILHIEEVQSDLHQQGRSRGYRESIPEGQYLIFDEDQNGKIVGATNSPEEAKKASLALPNGSWADREDNVGRAAIRDAEEGVPEAPFKKSWPELLLKRMVRYASDNGYDGVSWTPGDAQAERYDLSKQVSELRYRKQLDGDYHVEAYLQQGGKEDLGTVPGRKLADHVGKEVAQKIVNGEGEDSPGGRKRLVGDDLKVGGAGMKAFYDQIIPAAANKLGKQWGAKVGTTFIDTAPMGSEINIVEIEPGEYYEVNDPSDPHGAPLANFATRAEAEKYVKSLGGKYEEVPYLPITPEMRGAGPFPLFHLIYKSPSATRSELEDAYKGLDKAKNPTEYQAAVKNIKNVRDKGIGQIRELPDKTKILYLSRAGLQTLHQGMIYGKVVNPNVTLEGVSLSPQNMAQIWVNLKALNPPLREELQHLLLSAKDKQGTVVVAPLPEKGQSIRQALGVLREELSHGWQKKYGHIGNQHLSVDDFTDLNKAIPESMNDYLVHNGYAPDDGKEDSTRQRVIETSAKLLADAPSEFGLTEDEAAMFLFQYFEAVERQHGPKSLNELKHITTLARSIKEDYASARGSNAEDRGTVQGVQGKGSSGDQGSSPPEGGGAKTGGGGEGGTFNLKRLLEEAKRLDPRKAELVGGK